MRRMMWFTFVFMVCVVALHIIQYEYLVVHQYVAAAAIGAVIGQTIPFYNILKYVTS